MEPKGSATEVKAEVPMAEVLDYAPDLRAITGGRGDFTMEFAHHEEIPSHLAQKVISEAKSEAGGQRLKVVSQRRWRVRGNPGPAAIAAVATDQAGEVLAERSETIGEATNNVAEYRAMLLGIELAQGARRRRGRAGRRLRADRPAGARRATRSSRSTCARCAPRSSTSCAGCDQWSISNVPREQNVRADELVNEALDRLVPAYTCPLRGCSSVG